MAKLVMGIGVPHTPFFPGIAKQQGDSSRMVGLFKRVRRELESANPDLIVMLTTDHFVSFFFDNMPTFCIGAFEHADGPHELSRMMQQYRLQGSAGFAAGLVKYGIDNNFDLGSSEEVKLDHAALVPLHFLTPDMKIPVVPIFIKALVEPLPRAERCLALGYMVRRYIEQRAETERIAIIASGSFSLEVGGPRMGFVNKAWHAFVVECRQFRERREGAHASYCFRVERHRPYRQFLRHPCAAQNTASMGSVAVRAWSQHSCVPPRPGRSTCRVLCRARSIERRASRIL
jgi:catalytic LigB subunit of aromatic ring-opening dioxygenase